MKGIPTQPEVASFIRASFRSVWSLELLCLLRSEPARGWSHGEMVAALRGSDLVVRQSLESLVAAGLVLADDDGSARYQPVSPALDALVTGAEALYKQSPDAVRRMIVGAANSGLAAFAESFRLRKD